MSEFIKNALIDLGILKYERNAVEAMDALRHAKGCPAYGKDPIDSAELFYFGIEEHSVPFDTSGFGHMFRLLEKTQYVQCTGCGAREIYQERQ